MRKRLDCRKLSDDDVDLIRSAYQQRTDRIAEIDAQIQALGLERDRLRDRVSHRQLALKFEVSETTVARILRFEART